MYGRDVVHCRHDRGVEVVPLPQRVDDDLDVARVVGEDVRLALDQGDAVGLRN